MNGIIASCRRSPSLPPLARSNRMAFPETDAADAASVATWPFSRQSVTNTTGDLQVAALYSAMSSPLKRSAISWGQGA